MEILQYTLYGFAIGFVLSMILIFMMYSRKIVSGIFATYILAILAGGGAFVGLLIGLIAYDGEWWSFWAILHPSNLLAGHISSILAYLFIVSIVYYQFKFYKLRLPRRQFNRKQAKLIEGIWQKFEAKFPEMDERKLADKPKNLKEMKNMISQDFDAAILFQELEKQPEIIDQYITDLSKYALQEANLYFKYVVEEDEEALNQAAKLGHLQAIKTLHKLKKK